MNINLKLNIILCYPLGILVCWSVIGSRGIKNFYYKNKFPLKVERQLLVDKIVMIDW